MATPIKAFHQGWTLVPMAKVKLQLGLPGWLVTTRAKVTIPFDVLAAPFGGTIITLVDHTVDERVGQHDSSLD
eukprot:scaffold355263_cov18-Prasinocladus_malaysianus.AAC.1